MRNFKSKLLAATIMVGAATPAFAQFSFPDVELRGVGASTISDIHVKVQNCIGLDQDLGLNTGVTTPIVEADYAPSLPSVANPSLICTAGEDIYNGTTDYTGKYVSTGSGFARQQFVNFTNNFLGTPTLSNPFGAWPNVQYAFSEAPLTPANIADYNSDVVENFTDVNGNVFDGDVDASAQAGAAIQLPTYVIPIAFAYNQSYGRNAVNQVMNFNNKFPLTSNAVAIGGQRLRKATYCRIWNGDITNWNHDAIRTDNGAQPLFDPLTDNATRWGNTTNGTALVPSVTNGEGAPIRILGRADRSGGTDVFTRAIAAQCNGIVGTNAAPLVNKFLNAAESLPYNQSSGFDYAGIRADTRYRPTFAYSPSVFAGSINSTGGAAFDRNGISCLASSATGGVCAAGVEVNTPGLFILADGSTLLERAIAANTGTALVTLPSGARTDGKIGYIGGDFTAPTPGRSLFSAALQVGVGASFVPPTALNANAAFSTVFAPESTAGSGAYNENDTRQVYKDLAVTAQPGDTQAQILAKIEEVDRQNPLHWVNILYPAPFDSTGAPLAIAPRTLANPTAGYPVTGVANILTYTCFSDNAKRSGVANTLGYIYGKITKKNAVGGASPPSLNLSANTLPGTAAASLGVLAKSNTSTVPAGWRNAITETFLKKSTQVSNGTVLGSLNLWIQSKIPTGSADVAGAKAVVSNPSCTVGKGA